MPLKAFGRLPKRDRLRKIEQSANYKNGQFQNTEPTEMMLEDVSYFRMLIEFAHKPKLAAPSQPIPVVKTDLLNIIAEQPTVVWFGHSSYLLKFKNFTILVDPVLFGGASPIPPIGKPFAGTTLYKPEDIPNIDLLLLTHDHYDHLSYLTLKKLKNKIHKIISPFGVGAHLEYWGFDRSLITELDWQEKTSVDEQLKITAVPARHFSGRLLRRNKTLWASYVLDWGGYKIFVGGDSGFGRHFKVIGEQYGPFDLAFLECGQYGKNWPYIHMFPEQVAQAGHDLKAKVLFPVHWAKFILSIHAWNEPIKRLLTVANNPPYQVVTPKIGELYQIGQSTQTEQWWNFDS